MSNTILNVCRLRVTLPILSKLIASMLLVGVLCDSSATVQAELTNQGNKAKEAAARRYIGILNRTQQAFYLENGKFASNIKQLGVGVKQSKDYFYTIYPLSDPTQSVVMAAKGYSNQVKGYLGGVFVAKVNGEALTIAGICETVKPGFLPGEPKAPKEGSKLIECPAGYQLFKF